MAILLALAVGLVLADSSVVTLALPEILREFDASVGAVAWVLIAFNVALAVAAVPALRLVRAPARAYAVAVVVFAAASATCAAAPSLGVLIAARSVQGLAGAVIVAAALDLLVGAVGRDAAIPRWGAAGVVGAAVGPAAGGLLTEALSWQGMFAVQAPVALLALLGARATRPAADPPAATAADPRPAAAPLAALAFVSAALAAALFLLVLLVIEGWRHSPAEAALTVSLLPVATLVAARAARGRADVASAAAGVILVAGGLCALGLLPRSGPAWTLAPQLLVGAGLGLALATLTGATLGPARAPGRAAAWTIAARHAGIVAGLLILTPVFNAGLDHARDPAERAGVGRLLDARLELGDKISLARALDHRVDVADGRLPDLAPAFAHADVPARDRPALNALHGDLDNELDRAGTDAFSTSFLVAGGLAALALLALWRSRDGPAPRRRALIGGALAATALVVGIHLALGGAGYGPTAVADPCAARRTVAPDVRGGTQRAVLAVLDGAACDLRTSREQLLLTLLRKKRPEGASNGDLSDAIGAGIRRAQQERVMSPVVATGVRLALKTRGPEVLIGLLLKSG